MKRPSVRFYVLHRRVGLHGCDALQTDDAVIGEPPRCEACGDPIGMRAWLPPLRVNFWVCREGYCDLVYPTNDDILVSLRFKKIFEHEHLRGLSSFDPVELAKVRPKRRAKEPPPAYFRARVCRSQAVLDKVASGYEAREPGPTCPVCLVGPPISRWKGIVIKEETWPGEDILHPRGGSGHIIVSERFKQICERHAVKNACFVPAEEYSGDFYPAETEDWAIRIYDETLAVLRTMNKAGRLDDYVRAMEEMREHVLIDPEFDWIEALRERFEGRIDPIGDAAHDAHYNLVAPWIAKYVRNRGGQASRS